MSERSGQPSSPQLILAFDYGVRRIGVASGDTLTRTARPVQTLQCADTVPWASIDALVREYRPARFIVGLPLNMDGTPTLLTDRCRAFGLELKRRHAAPTALIDERLSSREAEAALREARAGGLKRRRVTRSDVDMIAARILLERWFQEPQAAEEL